MGDLQYRYTLHRDLGMLDHIGRLVWVMLNPSTADASTNDPTIRKVIGFTRRNGFGELKVVNLCPVRATDPRDLPNGVEALGDVELADRAIVDACAWGSAVVLAWGAHGADRPARVARVEALVRASGRPIYTLGRTKSGQPKHPLYVSYETPLQVRLEDR